MEDGVERCDRIRAERARGHGMKGVNSHARAAYDEHPDQRVLSPTPASAAAAETTATKIVTTSLGTARAYAERPPGGSRRAGAFYVVSLPDPGDA